MLKNPYPPPSDDDDKECCRFATYIDPGDRALLMSLRAVRGTAQAAVNNLILNICNDLRDIKFTSYRPDADDILAILVERRPFTDDQIRRLRRTTLGVYTEIPSWLQQHRGRTEVREGATSTKTEPTHTSSRPESRVGRDRTEKTSEKKKHSQEGSTKRGGHS